MNRRSFLKVGAIVPFSPALLQAIENKREEKSCIFIFLGGGISHIEFLNPIPDAPKEYRSTTGAIKTRSGWDIGGTFPELAKVSNLFTGVRSFRHIDGNHFSATHGVMTGHIVPAIGDSGAQKEPAFGSLVAQRFGENTQMGVPTYLKTRAIPHDDAAWVGVRYSGFDYNDDAIRNLTLNISEDRFKSRLHIMDVIDGKPKDLLGKQWGEIKDNAEKIIVGNAGKVLDIKNADEKDKQYYGIDKSGFGRELLIARRSIEAGSKFVTVEYGGWDMHSDINTAFPTRSAEFDRIFSAFLVDLERRGMLKNTMVVVASEFGRTPKINQSTGRDHWPNNNSLILAGGNYGGSVIGETDKNATSIISNAYEPKDLTYTILDHFGFEKSATLVDNMRRPRHLIEDSAKIIGA